MSEVLGYDCNGKALSAGDAVIIVDASQELPNLIGRSTLVTGVCARYEGLVELDIKLGPGAIVAGPCHCLCLISGAPDDNKSAESKDLEAIA